MDRIDDALLALLAERLAVAAALGRAKSMISKDNPNRDPGRDPARERAVVDRLVAQGRLPAAIVEPVWAALFAASRAVQTGQVALPGGPAQVSPRRAAGCPGPDP